MAYDRELDDIFNSSKPSEKLSDLDEYFRLPFFEQVEEIKKIVEEANRREDDGNETTVLRN